MTPTAQPELGFSFVPTPNPAELAISVTVSGQDLTPERMLTPGVDTYDDFKLGTRERVRDFSGYVFTYSEAREGLVTFYFAKNKTNQERNTPFRSLQKVDNFTWHPVLKQIKFLRDNSFPHATQYLDGADIKLRNAARYYARLVYVPAATEGTLFITEYFFAEVPFNIPQTPVPMAGAVQWHFMDCNGGFQECLHKRIVIGGQRTGPGGVAGGQVFPATNFTQWEPFVTQDTQEFSGGGYLRIRVTVYPPPEPPTITI